MSTAGFLLDTNVLSEFNRNQPPDPSVKQWVASARPDLLYVSVITLSEIRFGIELLGETKRRKQLENWFLRDLHDWFEGGRILGIDERIGNVWARMTAQRQLKGRPLGILDGLIAATALDRDLTVVTRNTRDFDDLDLQILNPWEWH